MKKEYKIIRKTHLYSTSTLKADVEKEVNDLSQQGWEIVSVSFSFSGMWMPAAFITICRMV